MAAALLGLLIAQAVSRGQGTVTIVLAIVIVPATVVCAVWYYRRTRSATSASPAPSFSIQLSSRALKLLTGESSHLTFTQTLMQRGVFIDSERAEISVDVDGRRVPLTSCQRRITLVCTRSGRLLWLRMGEQGYEESLHAHGRIRLPSSAPDP
jgi:hypothetical protein